ncbi:hypothetical protein C0J52_10862 [Blattella germanica]|nr:hypothetical protein C0J52_10862 [Blattella germanica]
MLETFRDSYMMLLLFVQCIGEGAWCGQSGRMFDLHLFWIIITSWVIIRVNVEKPKISTESFTFTRLTT